MAFSILILRIILDGVIKKGDIHNFFGLPPGLIVDSKPNHIAFFENPAILNEGLEPFATSAIVDAKELFHPSIQLNWNEVFTHRRMIWTESLSQTDNRIGICF